MIKLNMKNYNTTLTEKHKKYKHNHQVKLINMNSYRQRNIIF